MRQSLILVLTVAALAIIGSLVVFGSDSPPQSSAPTFNADIAHREPSDTPEIQTERRRVSDRQDRSVALPRSFRHTDIDGSVSLDDNDHVVPTRSLRDLFDYYISGVGEYQQADAAIAVRQQLRAYAHSHGLRAAARQDLLALFDRYLVYRQAVAAYMAEQPIEQTEQALRIMSDMRVAYLGAEMAQAFYAAEERLTRAAIARRQSNRQSDTGVDSLSPAQRRAVDPVRLAERVQRLRASGAGTAAVASAREQAVGVAAAQRLQALDDQQTEWQTTLAAYRQEHTDLMASGMTPEDRQRALTSLRHRYFSDRDIRRVEALDSVAQPDTPIPSD